MTAREKAIQLIRAMYDNGSTDSNEVYRESASKRCAKKCVEELIDATYGFTSDDDFWLKVKDEIEKI